MNIGKIIALAALLIAVGYTIWTWDLGAPEIDWADTPAVVGRGGRITLHATDSGKGLRNIEVTAVQGDKRQTLLSEKYAGSGWPWQYRTGQRSVALTLEAADMPEIKEGDFNLEVSVEDQPNLWLFSRSKSESKTIRLDTTPPSVQALSATHFIRQGGAEGILYRVTEPPALSGVLVGDDIYRGYALPAQGSDVYICLFALRYDQPTNTPMHLFAEDEAGNRAQTSFQKEVIPVRFRKRDIQVSDSFIEKVSGEILTNTQEVTAKETPVATFVEINSRLRDLNHRQIADLTKASADHLLFNQPFLQLSNSQVEASFADQRTYYYQGQEIDHQTHQGFDLASTTHSPVECANDGVVLWAAYLGIYGNCVLVDHGLGLVSLYGHLSSFDVQKGQEVKRGQSLGRTGQTGLAGGDHLHFSVILQGVQINPLEWWDPKWVQRHVFSRLEGSPKPE